MDALQGDPSARFVPTRERARAEQIPLPSGEPEVEERWSGLFVISTILARTSWKDELLQHPDSVAHLSRAAPPPPTAFVNAAYTMVEDVGPLMQCVQCIAAPRFRNCRVCGGRGYVPLASNPNNRVPCSCRTGKVSCSSCLGNAAVSRIVLRYFEDEARTMRELFLPSHLRLHGGLLGLESAMESLIDLSIDPPEELRLHDLSGKTGGSAYRGGSRTVRPTFHGHDFGDTIERSIEALRAFGGGAHVLHYDIRAYAWPILRLRYPNPKKPEAPREIALHPDREGRMWIFGDTG